MTPVRLSRGDQAVDLWVNPDAVERWHSHVEEGTRFTAVIFRSGGVIRVNETPAEVAEAFRDPEEL